MLPQRQINNPVPTAIFAVVCAALGMAWVFDPAFIPASWAVRLAILACGLGIAGLGTWLTKCRRTGSDVHALRYIKSLCELDLPRLEEEAEADSGGAGARQGPWREASALIRSTLIGYARKLDEAEHHRAGAEVRARRLAAQCDQLQEILTGLADPILAVDPFGQIVLKNTSAEKALGLQAKQGEHPALADLTRCEELVSLLNETRRRKTPTQRTGEMALEDESGSKHWYRICCRTLSGAHDDAMGAERGGMHSAVAVFNDISGLKAIQKRNAEFVSAVSHEMKTPLASIRAYVELLADGDAEDEKTQEEFFNVINSQVERLQRLIDNLLNLARIEAGVVSVNKAPRSLNELLLEAVNVLQPAAEQKQITLTTEFSSMYLGVLADRDTLLQAAINLMSNALKYTHSGGSVVVRSRLDDQEVIFEVSDSGVGLSPEDCQKVFEKFYRVKKDREMAAGTGLGLPLVKHIVEDVHAGRIEVESELGRGSTFRIVLPSVGQLSA